MKIVSHIENGFNLAEIVADSYLFSNVDDAVDLLGNMYYQGFDRIVIYDKNINPDFFDLKNGLAGEILQKFSNYRIRLAIVGDFSRFTSKSLGDFIRESNKGKHINFVSSLSEAVNVLTTSN